MALIPVWAHTAWTHNSNGATLLDFLSTNGLFASNSASKHPYIHRITWIGHIAESSNVTKAVFNQIDYALCQKNAIAIPKDSRSYGVTDLNSDHKPVITRIRMDRLHPMTSHALILTSSVKTLQYQSIRNNCITD